MATYTMDIFMAPLDPKEDPSRVGKPTQITADDYDQAKKKARKVVADKGYVMRSINQAPPGDKLIVYVADPSVLRRAEQPQGVTPVWRRPPGPRR